MITEMELFGRAISLDGDAKKLGIEVKWRKKKWTAIFEGVSIHGTTLGSLSTFLHGFRMGSGLYKIEEGDSTEEIINGNN